MFKAREMGRGGGKRVGERQRGSGRAQARERLLLSPLSSYRVLSDLPSIASPEGPPVDSPELFRLGIFAEYSR